MMVGSKSSKALELTSTTIIDMQLILRVKLSDSAHTSRENILLNAQEIFLLSYPGSTSYKLESTPGSFCSDYTIAVTARIFGCCSETS